MAATMMSKAFAGTSLRQAVPTAGKVRQPPQLEIADSGGLCEVWNPMWAAATPFGAM